MVEATTAGDLHPGNGDRADLVAGDDLGQLLTVVDVVQLGAADEGHPILHEGLVEGAMGEGGAVSCDEEVTVVRNRR